jgi:hypothetical protein
MVEFSEFPGSICCVRGLAIVFCRSGCITILYNKHFHGLTARNQLKAKLFRKNIFKFLGFVGRIRIPMNNRKRGGCYNVSAVTVAVKKMAERAYAFASNYTKMGSVGVYVIKRI